MYFTFYFKNSSFQIYDLYTSFHYLNSQLAIHITLPWFVAKIMLIHLKTTLRLKGHLLSKALNIKNRSQFQVKFLPSILKSS